MNFFLQPYNHRTQIVFFASFHVTFRIILLRNLENNQKIVDFNFGHSTHDSLSLIYLFFALLYYCILFTTSPSNFFTHKLNLF